MLSTVRAYVLAVGLFTVLFLLIHSLMKGKKAPHNPWGAASLEWQTATPPITENFHETPKAGNPYVV